MVYTPGQPDDPHQPRPALVLSEDIRNRLRDDLIVIPIFSTGKSGPTRLFLPSGHGGLRRSGLLYCEEITSMYRDFLYGGPLGPRVSSSVLVAVVLAVRRAVGDLVLRLHS